MSVIEDIRARASWIEQNLLPYEPHVRAWLAHNRVYGSDADDIVQEMYARFGTIEALGNIREPLSYAIKVAHSILLNTIRQSRVVSITAVADLDACNVPAPAASPEDIVACRDEIRQLNEALADLPQRTRDVLLLRRVEGLSQRETAKKLAIAEKTVEKHMARAALFLSDLFGRGGKGKGPMQKPSSFSAMKKGVDDCND